MRRRQIQAAIFILPILAYLSAVPPLAARPNGGQDVGALRSSLQISLHASASTCQEDREIPAEELAGIDNATLLFLHAALSPNPGVAYQWFSTELQGRIKKGQFVNIMRLQVDPFAPFASLGVSHTYLAHVIGRPQGGQVVCGSLSKAENWVAFRAKPSLDQAWVLIDGKARNNDWTFVTGLAHIGGRWQVQAFHMGISTLGSLSASDVWSLARKEAERHHFFNAVVLYNTAVQLAGRGPSFELGIVPVIQEETAKVQVPSLLQGKTPFTWKFGRNQFQVLRVGPMAIAGKVYLLIAHEMPPWKNDEQADRKNRELIKDFAARFPEYSEVFAGIIGEADKIGGNGGYRTVEVLQNGSLVPM